MVIIFVAKAIFRESRNNYVANWFTNVSTLSAWWPTLLLDSLNNCSLQLLKSPKILPLPASKSVEFQNDLLIFVLAWISELMFLKNTYIENIFITFRIDTLTKKKRKKLKINHGKGFYLMKYFSMRESEFTGSFTSVFHFLRASGSKTKHFRPWVGKAKMCLKFVHFIW